jgi:hypothetical protein
VSAAWEWSTKPKTRGSNVLLPSNFFFRTLPVTRRLALWKDADPDIPILKEAKAEYAELQ